MRRALVVLVLVGVIGIAAVSFAVRADRSPKTRGDYCGPPQQIDSPPAIGADQTEITPAYERLASVPLALAAAEVPDGRLLIATKDGHVWQVPSGGGEATDILDLSTEVAGGTEQGLLGVAVPQSGGHAYIYATLTDRTARIIELALTSDGVDLATRRDVLVLQDPDPSHNGGKLIFDREGMLMLGLGDGGNGDRTGAAQDLSSPFGKILRINPTGSASGPYSIPPDNPYVGRPGVREEIWAYGLRNPWGWSLDAQENELWVGDAGQLCFEEVSMTVDGGKGQNFAWPHREGAHEFLGPVLGRDGEPTDVSVAELGPVPKRLVTPLVEYPHSAERCSVLGGVVYRGVDIPELDGTYLWADLCERAVQTLRRVDGRWVAGRLGGDVPAGIVAFAQGADGEVYLMSIDRGVFKLTAASGA